MNTKRSRLRVWMVRISLGLLLAVFGGLSAALLMQDITPLDLRGVRWRVDLINDAAAVVVPHLRLDQGKTRQAHLALFEKVERGVELTDDESANYRQLYQGILFRKQSYLRFFDHNLTVVKDLEMNQPNNVGGAGVVGSHDHHDFSVRSNAADLTAELDYITNSKGLVLTPKRVLMAIFAYKDLTDIMLHLGTVPQTKSVPYSPPPVVSGPIASECEEITKDFKIAQFSRVNSEAYWTAIHRALDRYDRLVLYTQAIVNAQLNPFERRLVGRWGSWQSIGPGFFNGYPPPRRPRP